MVKMFCNRCGKECKDAYYTVSIVPHDMYPDILETACCATAYARSYSPIEELNRQSHYCSDCVLTIDEFLKNEEENV